MVKGSPLIHKGVKTKIDTIGELIYSYRIAKGLTQVDLGKAIGTYIRVYKFEEFSPMILKYEKGYALPGCHNIYMLSEVLGIEKEPFFNMVLKEHYNRFIEKHHEKFFQVIRMMEKGKELSSIDTLCRYVFCHEGKLKHNFSKSSKILKNAFWKKKITDKITYKSMAIELNSRDGTRYYDYRDLCNIMHGRRLLSLRVLFEICDYLEIESFKLHKTIVEERAFAHAVNMMEQWEICKQERKNNG